MSATVSFDSAPDPPPGKRNTQVSCVVFDQVMIEPRLPSQWYATNRLSASVDRRDRMDPRLYELMPTCVEANTLPVADLSTILMLRRPGRAVSKHRPRLRRWPIPSTSSGQAQDEGAMAVPPQPRNRRGHRRFGPSEPVWNSAAFPKRSARRPSKAWCGCAFKTVGYASVLVNPGLSPSHSQCSARSPRTLK